jgi:hypothetical protein
VQIAEGIAEFGCHFEGKVGCFARRYTDDRRGVDRRQMVVAGRSGYARRLGDKSAALTAVCDDATGRVDDLSGRHAPDGVDLQHAPLGVQG